MQGMIRVRHLYCDPSFRMQRQFVLVYSTSLRNVCIYFCDTHDFFPVKNMKRIKRTNTYKQEIMFFPKVFLQVKYVQLIIQCLLLATICFLLFTRPLFLKNHTLLRKLVEIYYEYHCFKLVIEKKINSRQSQPR